MSNSRPLENRNAGRLRCSITGGFSRLVWACWSLFVLPVYSVEPPAAVDARHWQVLVEPAFLRPPVSSALPGAKKTLLAAAIHTSTGPTYLTKAQFSTLATDWNAFAARAASNATEELRKLTPRFSRNRKEVIQYAELSSASPLVASTVLSPEFPQLFEQVFGPEVIVAIPNRFQVYVFPSLASQHEQFAPMVIRAYKETAHPVSLEVFKVNAAGIRAVGAYEQP